MYFAIESLKWCPNSAIEILNDLRKSSFEKQQSVLSLVLGSSLLLSVLIIPL